ncbi:Mg2+ transporter zinc transport protein [Neofusicoccum parvum]|nr:Mg2+ transporter zinc transport protein [Neofusicoccum parvum]
MGAAENNPHFLPEIWGLYVVGCIIFAMRFTVRLRTVGIKGLSGDDYFALAAWLFYTVDAVVVDRAYNLGTNVDFTDEEYEAMTSAQLHSVSKGSKYELVAWFSYSALIWSMKATMLFFYRRLTMGLWQQRLVQWLGIACLVTYLGVVLTILLGCRPFAANWRVYPSPGLQCTFRMQNIAVVSAFNIATDVALLSVPLPLLWRLQVPKRQKLIIAAFLLTGVFVIAAAVIRVVVTLGSNPSTTTINTWGVRETIVALVCVNAPMLRPLFLRRFWSTDTWHASSNNKSSTGGFAGATGDRSRRFTSGGYASRVVADEDGGRVLFDGSLRKEASEEGLNDAGSEEYIMKSMARENVDRVVVEYEVEVRSEVRREGERTDEELGNTAYLAMGLELDNGISASQVADVGVRVAESASRYFQDVRGADTGVHQIMLSVALTALSIQGMDKLFQHPLADDVRRDEATRTAKKAIEACWTLFPGMETTLNEERAEKPAWPFEQKVDELVARAECLKSTLELLRRVLEFPRQDVERGKTWVIEDLVQDNIRAHAAYAEAMADKRSGQSVLQR